MSRKDTVTMQYLSKYSCLGDKLSALKYVGYNSVISDKQDNCIERKGFDKLNVNAWLQTVGLP